MKRNRFGARPVPLLGTGVRCHPAFGVPRESRPSARAGGVGKKMEVVIAGLEPLNMRLYLLRRQRDAVGYVL